MMRTTGKTVKGGRKRPAHLIRAAVAFIGFMLSPLTPWNDSFVNIPLAILIAMALRPIVSFDIGYWIGYTLTNVLGLAMLFIAAADKLKELTWKTVLSNLIIAAIVYVLLHIFFKI
ncbi:hypothetical protein IPA_09660 [Ignicoccus pacificus DSM 13166]|uniref:Uncharacterized protein n=1 Tax=Ignicoccus pacificus DSM 13166 TaxID=940294 RepID=A0A977KBP8_9CREN|nr:hypothetical protein IPA_09660 [Ignicoccus pacificus DSM 13166]